MGRWKGKGRPRNPALEKNEQMAILLIPIYFLISLSEAHIKTHMKKMTRILQVQNIQNYLHPFKHIQFWNPSVFFAIKKSNQSLTIRQNKRNYHHIYPCSFYIQLPMIKHKGSFYTNKTTHDIVQRSTNWKLKIITRIKNFFNWANEEKKLTFK